MRCVCLLATVAIVFLRFAPAAKSAEVPTIDYQEVADRWEWQWSPDRADLITAVVCYRGPYQVEIVRARARRNGSRSV